MMQFNKRNEVKEMEATAGTIVLLIVLGFILTIVGVIINLLVIRLFLCVGVVRRLAQNIVQILMERVY